MPVPKGKTIDLGSKPSRIETGPSKPSKYYPSIHIDGLDKGSTLLNYKPGDTFVVPVEFEVREIGKSESGGRISLEAKKFNP